MAPTLHTLPNAQALEFGLASQLKVSFEFFPPKTPDMAPALWQAVDRLAPLAPAFVSVTYGAGGSTRERTHVTIERILATTDLVPAKLRLRWTRLKLPRSSLAARHSRRRSARCAPR